MPDGPAVEPDEHHPEMGGPEERKPSKEAKPRSAAGKFAVGCSLFALLICVGLPTFLLTSGLTTTDSANPNGWMLSMVGWFGTYWIARAFWLRCTLPAACVAFALLGFVAILAGPSFVRSRVSANESSAQLTLRDLLTAQSAYKREMGEFAPNMVCLARPSCCVPTYRGAAFLHEGAGTYAVERGSAYRGYIYQLFAWPHASKTVDNFCYAARPVMLNRTGTRSFGGDASGALSGTRGSVNCCREDGTLSADCEKMK
jgi:type II secretory pathway pseudopilin PulG